MGAASSLGALVWDSAADSMVSFFLITATRLGGVSKTWVRVHVCPGQLTLVQFLGLACYLAQIIIIRYYVYDYN